MFFKKQLDDNSIMGSLDNHLDKDECDMRLAPAFPDLAGNWEWKILHLYSNSLKWCINK